MSEANLQTLIGLERITRLMLEQAKCADWGQVELLEEERKNFVSRGLFLEVPPQDLPKIQTRFKKIIDLDNELMALVRDRREELSRNLSRFNQGRKANQAYQHYAFPKR